MPRVIAIRARNIRAKPNFSKTIGGSTASTKSTETATTKIGATMKNGEKTQSVKNKNIPQCEFFKKIAMPPPKYIYSRK